MVGKIVIKTLKILLLMFIAGFTLAFSFWFAQRMYVTFWELPKKVEVPDLVGEDATEADNALKAKGLSLTIVNSRYEEKYPSNTIIKQDPPPGILVRKGRQIMAVVSLGPELMEMPNLRGISLRDSKVLLGNNKLRLGKVTNTNKPLKNPGEILAQKPFPGAKVKKGTRVNIMVNKGDEPMIKVPNLVDEDFKDAKKLLGRKTLQIGTVVWEWHDYIPKGKIFRMKPNPGSMVQPRTPIDLKVSGGQKGFDLDLKQRTFVIFAPKGEGLQQVKVRQLDSFGNRTIYEGKHAPGGKIKFTVHSWGNTEVQIYNNTKLVKRVRF